MKSFCHKHINHIYNLFISPPSPSSDFLLKITAQFFWGNKLEEM